MPNCFEPALLIGTDLHMLTRRRTMAAGGKHLPPRQRDLHRSSHFLRSKCRQSLMWPDETLATETAAYEVGNDVDALAFEREHVCDGIAGAHHPLSGVVKRQFVAIPDSDCCGR